MKVANTFLKSLIILTALIVSTACASTSAKTNGSSINETQRVLVTITSESTQTQGMALVLSGQMLNQGADLTILLCNEGGYIAVEGHRQEKLQPFNLTPSEQLAGLIERGADVQLCALFLPNNDVTAEQLLHGVTGRAQPPEIARMMLDPSVRVFNF